MATFKVGQRVRFVKAATTLGLADIGKTGKIDSIGVLVLNHDTAQLAYCDYGYILDGERKLSGANGYQLEPIIDSGRTVVEFEVGVSPWVPEHLRQEREQPATEEPGLTK